MSLPWTNIMLMARYEPKTMFLGPKMGPKLHFSLKMTQKQSQTNENHR
jgi:hypothetical protein